MEGLLILSVVFLSIASVCSIISTISKIFPNLFVKKEK